MELINNCNLTFYTILSMNQQAKYNHQNNNLKKHDLHR